MRAKLISRNIFAYAIHAHGKKFKGDYQDLFSRIAQMEKKDRVIKRRDLIVAITDIRENNGLYFITFVEGEAGLEPLILDLSTGEAHRRA